MHDTTLAVTKTVHHTKALRCIKWLRNVNLVMYTVAATEIGNLCKHPESKERPEERENGVLDLQEKYPSLGWDEPTEANGGGSPESSRGTRAITRGRAEIPSLRLLKNELSLKVTVLLPLLSDQCN